MATIQDTDLLYVQRGDVPHNWTGQELLAQVTASASDGKLSVGQYLTPFGQTYDGSGDLTINLDGVPEATPLKAVVRDADGSFAGNKITVTTVEVSDITVNGNITGNGNFSGNLEVDGYIQADGAIETGDWTSTNGGIKLDPSGSAYFRPEDSASASTGVITAYDGGTAAANKVFSVEKSGSVNAAGGDVAISSPSGTGGRVVTTDSTNERKVYLGTSGTTSGVDAGFQIWDDDNDVTLTALYNDGSITAAGTVKTTPDITTAVGFRVDYTDPAGETTYLGLRSSGVDYAFAHYDGSTITTGIDLDGNITTAGDVQIGGWDTSPGLSTTQGAYIYSVGAIQVNRTSDGAAVLVGRKNGDMTSQILGDGSITAVGGVFTVDAANGIKFTSNSGAFAQINGDGIYQTQTDGTSACRMLASGDITAAGVVHSDTYFEANRDTGTYGVFYGQLNGTNTTSILANGSATFAGPVEVGNKPTDGAGAGARLSNNGPIEVARGDSTSENIKSYLVGTSSPTFSVTAGGSITATGLIQGQSIRTDSTGGQITSNYNLVTESTSDSHGLFIGNPNADGVKANAAAWIDGAGQAYYSSSVTATGGFYGNIIGNVTGKADDSALLNGKVNSTGETANTIVERDSNADITGRYLYGSYCNMSHGAAERNSDSVFYSSTDGFIRKNTAVGMRTSLNVPTRTGGDASGSWGISVTGSSASCTGNSASASTVTVNSGNDSDGSYYLVWHSGNSVYSTNGVYINPSSDAFYANGWHYTQGDNGFYNNTHGGGWNMLDTTWFRIYNSKSLYVNNSIAATGNVTAYYSDERLKEKLGDVENAVEKVCAIETMYYKHNDVAKELGYEGDEKQLGVTAQSVKKVAPEVIHRAPIDIETHEDGTFSSKSGEDYMTVDYSRLVPLLIESIKEQQKTINTLEERIAQLEA